MRWNQKNVLDEIRRLHRDGTDLSFNWVQDHHLALLRAATNYYGSWKFAVESAGYDYEKISRYRRWTRARVLTAIREHHRAGRDLSWRSVAHVIDPSLAAAALRPGVGFESWREAVTAAGLSPDQTARYKHWTPEKVVAEIQQIAERSEPLSSQAMQRSNQPLFCAARRRFKTWNGALEAAGIDPQTVQLRRATNVKKPNTKTPKPRPTSPSNSPAKKPAQARSAPVKSRP